MASLKWLFLGVYTSNRIIRVLFLPICYVLLLSPILLIFTYYSRLGRQLASFIPHDFSVFDLLPQIALSAVFLLLPTRLLSVSGQAAKSKDGRKRRIQLLPYWIPGVRHLGSIISGAEDWMKGVRLVDGKSTDGLCLTVIQRVVNYQHRRIQGGRVEAQCHFLDITSRSNSQELG